MCDVASPRVRVAEIPLTRGRPWLAERRYVSYHVVCLALLPLVLLTVNGNIFINPAGNDFIDPWVYTGFFLSFRDLLHRFGDTYYSTRLPWLLPGFALHTLLPPLAANYTLHLTFFYLLLLSTYALAASGANRSVAFVTTVMMALNPLLLTSFSWDYVDGAGIVFLLITICSVGRATRPAAESNRWRWSLIAGGAMACLVSTNLALVTTLPACAAFLLVRAESPRWRTAFAILATSVVGAAAMLVTLGALNRAFGGSWLFLQASIHFGMRIRTATNIWKASAFDWSRAEWIALPLLASVGAIVSLAATRRAASRFEQAPQVALLALVATWLVFDVLADTAFFRYSYYTSYIVALAVIALPLQGGPIANNDRRGAAVGFELAILTVLAIPHVLAWFGSPYRYGIITWAPSALIVAVIGLQVIRRPSLRWGVFIVGLTLSYAASNQYWKALVQGGRADFVTTAGAHRFIERSVADRTMRIWYPALKPTSPPFRSIACTFLCNRMLVNEELPRLNATEAAALQPAFRLVMLVKDGSEAEEARASLRAFGLDYTVIAREQFGRNDRTLLVIVADVVPVQTATR